MSRRVLITAGASGIGLCMAQTFAGAGDRVWVTDIDDSALASLPDGIRGTRVDAADAGEMDRLFEELVAEWGGLDVAVANAGIKGPTTPIEEMDPGEWRECLTVCLDGAMLLARGAARLMKPAGSGTMIFISSTAGLYPCRFRAPYVAAKFGVIGLMQTVQAELGPHGIRANAICPGSVEGPRIDRVIAAEAAAKGLTEDAVRQAYASGTALRQLTRAQDVADTAFHLASSKARMIAGQAISVDGMTINPDP